MGEICKTMIVVLCSILVNICRKCGQIKKVDSFFALLFSVVTVLGFCNSVVVDFDMPPQWQYQWCISLCIQISDVTIIEIKIEIVIF